MKVYELKKGDKLIYNEEIITFEEIRGDLAIFTNEWGEEFSFPDYYYVDEIGEIYSKNSKKEENYPTLF